MWPHSATCQGIWRVLLLIPSTPRIRAFCIPLILPFQILLWCNIAVLVALFVSVKVMKRVSLLREETFRSCPTRFKELFPEIYTRKAQSFLVLVVCVIGMMGLVCQIVVQPPKRLLYEEILSSKLVTEHFFQRHTVSWSSALLAFLTGYATLLLQQRYRKKLVIPVLWQVFSWISLLIMVLLDLQTMIRWAPHLYLSGSMSMVLQK